MASSVINSDDGVISGTSGLKSSGGDDGALAIQSNGTELAKFKTTELVINDGGDNYDFRVEGDTDANLLFVDASTERVGVRTNSPELTFSVAGNIGMRGTTDHRLTLNSQGTVGTNDSNWIRAATTNVLYNAAGGTHSWEISGAERARITSGGYFKASNTGSYLNSTGPYHELRSDGANLNCLQLQNTSATGYGIEVKLNSEGTVYTALTVSSTSANRDNLYLYSNGNLVNRNNSYGSLSDVKLKQDIVDANSAWEDIKNVRVRKYREKKSVELYGDDAPVLLGVVAQELELTSPGLIDESQDLETNENGEKVPTGTVTKSVKYSVLYMKAVKALQEAMERIETLEAKVAALEAVPGNE
jgi:hypothetical protein